MKMTQHSRADWLGGGVFLALSAGFIVLAFTVPAFFEWAFQRHHNQWSWYIRPLFLIPYGICAYKRSFTGMMATLFALLTSMFWFPKPELVSEQVSAFLAYEQDYLYGQWNLAKVLISTMVPLSLAALGYTFWKRSLLMAFVVMVLIALSKILWSILNAGDSGYSIIVPAIIGLVICGGTLWWFLKKPQPK